MLVDDRSFSERAERIEKMDDIVVDLETNGLLPWKGDKLVGVGIEGDYFPFRHEGGGNLDESQLPKLLRAVRAGSKTYRGWHLRYDLSMLAYETGDDGWIGPDVKMRDGIIDALLMNENEDSFSLAHIAQKYLGESRSKTDMDALLAERFPGLKSKKARKGQLWRLPAHEVNDYVTGDLDLPRRLAAKYQPALDAWGLSTLAVEMNAFALQLARIQKHGILIDRERCEALSASTERRKADLLDEIRREIDNPKFNPNSSPQVRALLGTPDATQATLALLDSPIAQRITDYKKLGKAKSAYYDSILDLLGPDGVLHPQLNLTRDPSDTGGTKSCRLSCSDPNFQALPHADDDPNAIYKVRDLVIARPGMKLAKLDYERAEMWMGGHYSRDVSLFQAYHAGRDLYRELAAQTGITRRKAKILWLAIQYGAGIWKIAQMLGISEDEAREVKAAFFALCPGIKRAMYHYADQAEGTGVLRLWTGRACHFTEKFYAAWNRLIQGAVGEMVRLAMQRLEPALAEYGARIILQVHDELVLEYPEENERPVLALAIHAMTDFPQFRLRPRVEPNVGTNYAQMALYKEAA